MLEKIRNYQIKDLIATGGMAAVYRAVQVSLDRDVAIKILHSHLAQDEKFLSRFEREAKSAAALKHENIVDIIDYGMEGGKYFIAMEYVDGRSLKSILEGIREIPIEIALRIIADVLDGLEYAHKKGVIHRDIKPGNILISYEGKAKIADFGLAKAREQSSLTVTGTLVGTPAYMSPEQAVGKKVGQQSDIFSLGIVLYEMVTGIQPFRGETYSGVINEIISKTPRPLSEVKPTFADSAGGLLDRMLAKDIEDRWPDATSTKKALDQVVQDLNLDLSQGAVEDFLRDPVRYSGASKKRLAEKHFRQGLYLMKLGLDRIDDAIKEFEAVLTIDPDNIEAKTKLEQLRKKQKTKIRPFLTIPVLVVAVLIAVFIIIKGGIIKKDEIKSSLSIDTNPDSCNVSIDGREAGLSPILLDSVSSGRHIIEINQKGFVSLVETVDIKQESMVSLSFNLTKENEVKSETIIKRPVIREPAVQTGILIIDSKPQATVYINGRKSKSPAELKTGKYDVVVKKKGYKKWQGKVNIRVGEETVKKIVLKPLAGYVVVKCKPWADFFINGKYIGTTPLKKVFKLKPGSHAFKLSNPDYWPWLDTLRISPGETLYINQGLAPK